MGPLARTPSNLGEGDFICGRGPGVFGSRVRKFWGPAWDVEEPAGDGWDQAWSGCYVSDAPSQKMLCVGRSWPTLRRDPDVVLQNSFTNLWGTMIAQAQTPGAFNGGRISLEDA